VIEIYDRAVHKEAPRELADDLAKTYMNKANALSTTLSNWRHGLVGNDRRADDRNPEFQTTRFTVADRKETVKCYHWIASQARNDDFESDSPHESRDDAALTGTPLGFSRQTA
jgi:hypothetical protein